MKARSGAVDDGRGRVYRIWVQGCLGPEWAEWFEGLAVSQLAGGDTLLTGVLTDQAALYGVLRKVRDLGMPLLGVCCAACTHAGLSQEGPGEEGSEKL